MANRTVKDAKTVKGTNPQYLIEKIIRSRIYDCKYWKEECFALTAELLVDRAMELRYIGGVFGGNVKPTPFICLILKMLQIQPEKDIVIEFIKNEDFKYVRAIGAFYLRLIGTSLDCYKYLEPLYNDYRKLRYQNRQGAFELKHMDEFIDELLREERCCDIILPRIQKRHVLEDTNALEPRVSALDDDVDDFESEEDEGEISQKESPSKGKEYQNNRYGYRGDPRQETRSERFRRERGKDERAERGEWRNERSRGERIDSGRERDRERYRDERYDDHERRRAEADRSRRSDREREKKHRDKEDYHHHERDRDREREHRRRGGEGEREKDDRRRKEAKHRDRGDRGDRHRERDDNEEEDIAQANALRARLGLQPLRA